MTAPAFRRIVVKVGTSTLTDSQGRIDRPFLSRLAAQLAAQRAAGRDVMLVTSGAIRAGREALTEDGRRMTDDGRCSADSSLIPHPSSLPLAQAAAAVGQGLLMHTYTEAFRRRGVTVAQVLLTRDDLADRKRYLNARATLTALLSLGVVPVINENDTVAVEEIKFGDNDQLAAHVAVVVEADLLLILSDVEGLYAAPPHSHTPTLLPTVFRITPEIEALAGGSQSGFGTGGMQTKIEAARIATGSGIRTVIARGRCRNVIADVLAGHEIGTTFLPGSGRPRGRKRWIAAGSRPKGAVTVNARAAEKLRSAGVSLLAVGITNVAGDFNTGDLIEVRDETGRRFGRGVTNYSAPDLCVIAGNRSDQFESLLGVRTYDEVIHRDNLVVES